jgi:hypothetical protein
MITIDIGANRSMKRGTWKALWRQMRIIQREAMKAAANCAAFGTGFVEIGSHVPDCIRSVDPSEMFA